MKLVNSYLKTIASKELQEEIERELNEEGNSDKERDVQSLIHRDNEDNRQSLPEIE